MDKLKEKGVGVGILADFQKDTLDKMVPGVVAQAEQVEKAQDDELSKALSTGHEINPEEVANGSALRAQYLKDDLTTLTFREQDLYFYDLVPKSQVNNTVVQHNVLTSYGEVGATRFVREPEVAPENDPSIIRRAINLKFLSDTRRVTIASQIVDSTVSPLTIQVESALRVTAKTIEWASFYGDADLSDSTETGQGLQFDGLAKLIAKDAPENVIDARGEALSEQLINLAATKIAKGFGTPTDAIMPIGVLNEFNNRYQDRQVALVADGNGNMTTGINITKADTVAGRISLHGSTIMETDNILDEVFKPSRNAPLPAKIEATLASGVTGNFREEDLGELEYVVTVNGEDAVSAKSAPATATVSDKTGAVELTVTLQTMYQQSPQFVTIYRKGKSGNFQLIARVATKGQSELKFVDKNDIIPDTADAFIGQFTSDAITLYELLPVMQLPLARTNATTTFSVLWYGALGLFTPRKFVHIKNLAYTATNELKVY